MNNNVDRKNWYVFYCKSRSEKKAKELLEKFGYEVFLPLIIEHKKWSDRIKKVSSPMFRGYIFIYTTTESFSNIYQISPQIVAAVRIGTKYAYLKPKDIDFLKLLEENDLKVIVQPKRIKKQSTVTITNGPFAGQEGVCIEELGSNYFIIEVEAINQEIKIRVHEAWLLENNMS